MPLERFLVSDMTLLVPLSLFSFFTCMVHSSVCYCALQSIKDLAAWIVNDHADLELEVCQEQMFGFFTKQEMTQLLTEKTEVESYLNQANGHIHSLEGDL